MRFQQYLLETMLNDDAPKLKTLQQIAVYADHIDMFVSFSGVFVASQAALPWPQSFYPSQQAKADIERETLVSLLWLETIATILPNYVRDIMPQNDEERGILRECYRNIAHSFEGAVHWGSNHVRQALENAVGQSCPGLFFG